MHLRIQRSSCTIAVYLAATNDSNDESDASSVSEFPVGDNNWREEYAIFIRNLPSNIRFNDIFDLFSKIGRIKVCLISVYLNKTF